MRYTKWMMLLIFFVLLSGCCSWCPVEVKEVYIKTGCVKPAIVISPTLKTYELIETSTYKETVEAYVFDLHALDEYTKQLIIALTPYQTCAEK